MWSCFNKIYYYIIIILLLYYYYIIIILLYYYYIIIILFYYYFIIIILLYYAGGLASKWWHYLLLTILQKNMFLLLNIPRPLVVTLYSYPVARICVYRYVLYNHMFIIYTFIFLPLRKRSLFCIDENGPAFDFRSGVEHVIHCTKLATVNNRLGNQFTTPTNKRRQRRAQTENSRFKSEPPPLIKNWKHECSLH